MTDQLALLPTFSWRGVTYPVAERSVSFTHENVQHKLQRRNLDLVEQTGAHNFVLTYSIPMREDLNKGPYVNLFTEGLQRLLDDCRNKEAGDLWDPIYGLLRCVPTSYDDNSDVNKRDGTDIKVEFLHSPESADDDIAVTPTGSAVSQDSREFEAEVQAFEVAANEADEIDPVTSIKLTDLLTQTSAFGRIALNTPNEILGEMNKITLLAKDIEETLEDATAPDVQVVRNRARNIRDRAYQVLQNSAQINPVRTSYVTTAKSVTSLAAEFKVSVAELLRANPQMATRPLVQPGTTIVIPSGKS